MSIQLTQQEADTLLLLEKHYRGNAQYSYPSMGGKLRIPLYSIDGKEEFNLSVWRGGIELRKNTFQTLARKAIVLARIDLGGVHRNPDGLELSCPHLHLYREGFADKWAVSLPSDFTNPLVSWQIFEDFMTYCKIATRPNIIKDLFT
jgi:hypothetical protein